MQVEKSTSSPGISSSRIGRLPCAGRVFLAPMAGFTNAAMRRVCQRMGAGLTYTEMVNAAGVLHDSDKTWHLLETFPDEGPIVAHLYGSDPSVLAAAAGRVAALGKYVALDLNAGCPMRKITSKGAGAALMKQPELIGRIVAAMTAATSLPVTVKTRIGLQPDKIAVLEILRAVEESGGAALAVHGRFATQEHSGAVRLDLLAEVKRASRIPVIGNGGISFPEDAVTMFRETGVDAVMIARGATGNPWIFREIAAALPDLPGAPVSHLRRCDTEAVAYRVGVRTPPRDLQEIRTVLEEHLAGEMELHRQIRAHHRLPAHAMPPELAAVTTFRCHIFRYLHGLKGSSYVRGHLTTMRTLEDVRAALDGCFEREAKYRAQAPEKLKE
ncbi:MAG: tRNA dihydrouridine synthase [Kiritimatiellia bacterium]